MMTPQSNSTANSVPRIPRVSIGMPVYNGEKYVARSIEALLSQTFRDFELIVSDNASSDRTEEICRAYCRRDERVRYYRNAQNMGAAWNFRRVFHLATGEYFKWADHDDLCGPEFLEKCVAAIEANPPVAVCYPQSAIIDENGRWLRDHADGCNLRSPRASGRIRQYLTEASASCFPMFGVIRRNALEKTSLMASFVSSDKILLLQLALVGQFYEVPERLFFCRDHAERGSRQFLTFHGVAAWYDPRNRGKIQFPRWRLALEYFKSVRRAPLAARERLACCVLILKWCRWNYLQFVRDVVLAVEQAFVRLRYAPAEVERRDKGPGNPWRAWGLFFDRRRRLP